MFDKDEKKDEMKNRISLALKDPILQQGFEIICKENAELKEQQFSLRNERNTFLAQNEQYEKDLIDFNENLTKAKAIIKIAREAYIKSGVYTLNSEPVYKEEVDRLYALFFDRAEAFLNSEVEK